MFLDHLKAPVFTCLENPRDREAWWAAVHGVAEGRTRLSDFAFSFHFPLSCIGEGNGNPLQCSCQENPRDGGAWWAAISGVTQSWTRLRQLSSSSSSRCFLTSYICIPVPYNEKDMFFWMLVLKGLVGLHSTVQLQLLQHYWLAHRLGLL